MSVSEEGANKACLDCLRVMPLDSFPPAKKRRDGRASYCRACMNVRSKRSADARKATDGHVVRPRRTVPDGMAWCPDCQTFKPIEDLPRNKSARNGRGGYCKPCHNTRGVETYIRLYGSTREYHLHRKNGIGQAEVDAMLATQGSICPGCGKPNPEHVDHDHETNEVRGMLCFNCNQALGNVRDNVQVLEQLGRYLDRSRNVSRLTWHEYPPTLLIYCDPDVRHATAS
jgi:Recombination endonuclease VII